MSPKPTVASLVEQVKPPVAFGDVFLLQDGVRIVVVGPGHLDGSRQCGLEGGAYLDAHPTALRELCTHLGNVFEWAREKLEVSNA